MGILFVTSDLILVKLLLYLEQKAAINYFDVLVAPSMTIWSDPGNGFAQQILYCIHVNSNSVNSDLYLVD